MRLRDKLKSIPIARIKTDIVPDDKSLQESMLEASQKYPIKVRPVEHPDYDYEIVNGRQRIDAMLKTGANFIEAIVEPMDDVELHFQALIGNANKPNELDEARHIIELEQRGFTGQQIAKMTRFSPATISQRKKLVEKLHLKGQLKLQCGDIKVSTALEATKLPLTEQEELFKNGDKPSYKEVFQKVREWEASLLLDFDLETKSETKPGLFLTAEQVEALLSGQLVGVDWMGQSFVLKVPQGIVEGFNIKLEE
jgi:ParB/RepB/Spo0J family partition protein